MGHLGTKETYKKLRERLDCYPVGAPGRKTIYEILKIIYTPEEAELASSLPFQLSSLGKISRSLGIPADELLVKLESMADKGLVFDIQLGGKTRYMLTPTVVGIFEFSMMRVRDDIDQTKLAGLLKRYIVNESEFSSHYTAKTTPFRTLVHEEVIDDYTEILSWEKASHVVKEAKKWGVATCHCRHVQHHLNDDCKKFRMDCCLSLDMGADYLIRHGFAKAITREEALKLMHETRDAGLVHICDNVQRRPTFICNCCGCCCEILLAFKKLRAFNATFSSNFIARVNEEHCVGCRKCKKACPVDAIDIFEHYHTVKGKKIKFMAKVDRSVCIGCGVCALSCKFDSMAMEGREARWITPESTFARVITMALEQNTLHRMIFDENQLSGQMASALVGGIMKLPPAKQLLTMKKIKSRFIDFMLGGLKIKTGQAEL